MKKLTLKEQRNDPRYTCSLLLHGNGKLLDFDDPESCISYRYAQFNQRAIKDCPLRSEGCEAVCYATKGNHQFPEVKASRERSHAESLREDFPERILYTISVEKQSKRYKNAVMLIRLHESGDFYSVQYLRKWVKIWKSLPDGVKVVLYTKSFPFFLMLTEEEKEIIRETMHSGKLSMNLSMDDTTTTAQKVAYLRMLKEFPLCNTYTCTENVDEVEHDEVCKCEDCARCGVCNNSNGRKTAVKIHSASENDLRKYRKAKK